MVRRKGSASARRRTPSRPLSREYVTYKTVWPWLSGEVSRGEKMLYFGTDPESYITEYTLVYEDHLFNWFPLRSKADLGNCAEEGERVCQAPHPFQALEQPVPHHSPEGSTTRPQRETKPPHLRGGSNRLLDLYHTPPFQRLQALEKPVPHHTSEGDQPCMKRELNENLFGSEVSYTACS